MERQRVHRLVVNARRVFPRKEVVAGRVLSSCHQLVPASVQQVHRMRCGSNGRRLPRATGTVDDDRVTALH